MFLGATRLLILALVLAAASARAGGLIDIEIRGAISPASASFFLRALDVADQRDAELLLLRLDTPGGLDSAMRDMIRAILASSVPVVIYVSPSGARAASAGTYLLYASHVAAMAPGTNLGAATPVSIGPGGGEQERPRDDKPAADGKRAPKDAMEAKAMQDAAAYLRSLAQLRGRNAQWAERAVFESVSLSAQEAAAQKVIDFIAPDRDALLAKLDGRRIALPDGARTLHLKDASIETIEPNWKERLLSVIADPNVALMLMMVGFYGLLFEFYSPGMGVPGVLGAIALLLGLYGLALLPLNYAGVALLLLGLALMAAEAFVPSLGILGIGGVIAFVVGAAMLTDGEVPGMAVSMALVLPLAIVSALLLGGLGTMALRTRRRPAITGAEGMVGRRAQALEDIEREGWVFAFGERWHAVSSAPLRRGGHARVKGVDGLTLFVEPESDQTKGQS